MPATSLGVAIERPTPAARFSTGVLVSYSDAVFHPDDDSRAGGISHMYGIGVTYDHLRSARKVVKYI